MGRRPREIAEAANVIFTSILDDGALETTQDSAHPVRRAIADHRRWFRGVLRDILVADGHPEAERTADILVALKDGLLVGAYLDEPSIRAVTREAVSRLMAGTPVAAAPAGTLTG